MTIPESRNHANIQLSEGHKSSIQTNEDSSNIRFVAKYLIGDFRSRIDISISLQIPDPSTLSLLDVG